ncbi:uncharacterized protein DUF2283 [Curtobacterium sp. PhB115]|nr:uncharacterized protein DUF2283 [Curtobacterium sp. PhB115]
MPRVPFQITVDAQSDVAYITMSDSDVEDTRELTADVLVDVDALGMVVGIEVLRLDAEIPFQRLVDELHVHSADVETLRALRPSVASSLRLTQGTEGTSVQRGAAANADGSSIAV